jgi:hypothetical protein
MKGRDNGSIPEQKNTRDVIQSSRETDKKSKNKNLKGDEVVKHILWSKIMKLVSYSKKSKISYFIIIGFAIF